MCTVELNCSFDIADAHISDILLDNFQNEVLQSLFQNNKWMKKWKYKELWKSQKGE